MAEVQATRSELEPYTVVWHQKGEKPYVTERYKTPKEAGDRLASLWGRGHREAVAALTPRTDFAIALVWRFIQRDQIGRRERLEEQKRAAQ